MLDETVSIELDPDWIAYADKAYIFGLNLDFSYGGPLQRGEREERLCRRVCVYH